MLVMSNSGGGCDGPTSTDRADADAKTSTGGDERLLGSDGGDSSFVSFIFFSSSVTKRPNNLEYLSLAKLVSYLQERPEPTQVEHLSWCQYLKTTHGRNLCS
jgi:hypothetical protein